MKYLVYLLMALVLLWSCSATRQARTIHNTGKPIPGGYHKVVVVMVTGEQEVRKDSEELIARALRKNNQVAFTIPEVFGNDGLKGLDEEHVYLSLCDEGVDAVLVVAPVHFDDQPQQEFTHPLARNAYYFHRIWNYPAFHAPLTGRKQQWEAILFDLPTLAPHHVSSWSRISATRLSRQLTGLLLRDGVLKNPPGKKAF